MIPLTFLWQLNKISEMTSPDTPRFYHEPQEAVPLNGNFRGQSIYDTSQFDDLSRKVFNETVSIMKGYLESGNVPRILNGLVMFDAFRDFGPSADLFPNRAAFESSFHRLGGENVIQAAILPSKVGREFYGKIHVVLENSPDLILIGHRSKKGVRDTIEISQRSGRPVPIIDVVALEKNGIANPGQKNITAECMAILALVTGRI